MDRISSTKDITSNRALKLLRLFCLYHHDQIPVAISYNAWHNAKENERVAGSLVLHLLRCIVYVGTTSLRSWQL